MRVSSDVALLLALTLTACSGLAIAFFAGRRLLGKILHQRLARRVARVEALLRKHQDESFASTERMLFQLGELQDPRAVEVALASFLKDADQATRPLLTKLYRSLGLVDRYRKQLSDGVRWTERAAAARALGQLGVVEAIPELVERMRDPHEDPRSVKLAAAEALGEIRAPEAVPLLLKELEILDEWSSPRLAELLVSFGPVAVPPLLEALGNEAHQNARIWAAQTLGRIGDARAVGPLLARLRDRSEQVRMSAAEALGRLDDRQAVNELLQVALHDPVPPVRAEAARALGRLRDPSIVESLITLLADPDYWTRLRTIEAIELVRPDDITALDTALRDPSPEVSKRAAVALERLGVLGKRVADLAGTDRAAVERAERTLVEMGRAGLVESLLSHLEHADFRVRSRMADVMGDIGDARALLALAPLLRDARWPVRVRAVEAIAKLRPIDGAGMLLPILSDPEETVRAAAVSAIHAVGLPAHSEGIAPLIPLFDASNAEVRGSVLEAVGQVDRPEVEGLIERALKDPNEDVRLRAIQAAGRRKTDKWVPPLVGQLGDPSLRIRIAAVDALGRIGTPAAMAGVAGNLDTPDRELREAVSSVLAAQGVERVMSIFGETRTLDAALGRVWSLGKTADPAAVAPLAELARRPEPEVRAAVAGALAKVPSRSTEGILIALLGDRNKRVRSAAANALGNIACRAAVTPLLEAIRDPEPFVRNRAILALGKIASAESEDTLADTLTASDAASELRAHAVVACGLAGGERGFRLAVAAMRESGVEEAVGRILAQESEDVRTRFRENLHLETTDIPPETTTDLTSAAMAEHYAETLQTSNRPDDRAAAAQALQALDARRYRDRLIDAVRTDPSPEVRKLAVRALGAQVDDEAVMETLAAALRDPAGTVRIEAAAGIGRRADPKHNALLLRCFTTGDPELDHAVIEALAPANKERLPAFIDELMGHAEQPILRGGARVLGLLADPRAVGVLVAWRNAPSPSLRAAVIDALGRIGTVEARNAVLERITDPSEEVRMTVAGVLALMPGVEDALGTLCLDPSVDVRLELARALGREKKSAQVAILDRLTRDPEERVRIEALRSLFMVGGEAAIESFVRAWPSQTPAISASFRALSSEHPAVLAAVRAFSADRRPAIRVGLLRALEQTGHATTKVLLDALQDPTPEVRIEAVGSAAARKDPALAEALDRMIRDPDERVREAARKSRVRLIRG